jgi:hypothetical protein
MANSRTPLRWNGTAMSKMPPRMLPVSAPSPRGTVQEWMDVRGQGVAEADVGSCVGVLLHDEHRGPD